MKENQECSFELDWGMPVEVMKDFDAVLVRGYDARMDPVLLRARGIRRQNSLNPAGCSTSYRRGLHRIGAAL